MTTAVLYDADCQFCMTVAVAILDLDSRDQFRAVAIQSDEGRRLLPGMDDDQRLQSFHLVEPDGTVTSGGAALPRLAGRLPFGAPLKLALGASPALTDRGYRLVADHRIAISRWVPSRFKARARARLRPRPSGK